MEPQELTAKEAKALDEFKSRIKDVVKADHDDYYLCKWLIARNFNATQAAQMYRNSLNYKAKVKAETLLEEYEEPEVLKKYLAGGFCGHDKEGHPVKVELFGYMDMRGLMSSAKKTEFEKTKMKEGEWIIRDNEQQSAKLGRRVDGCIIIMDMDKVGALSLWRPGLNMYLHLVQILLDNYPETTKNLFTINAPAIMPILWKFAGRLVNEAQRRKMHFLGSDYKQVLLKHIDADQLPTYLGGTRTDPDGNLRCVTEICQGGTVPEKYYLTEEGALADDFCEAVIPFGEKMKLDFYVDKPGTLLRWEFRTEDNDIGFCVTYKKDPSSKAKEKEVVPSKRYNSHQVTEDDSIICQDIGTYVVIFDNGYSWTKSKKLLYLVEMFTTSDSELNDLDSMSSGGSWTRLHKGGQVTHL